MSFPNHVSKNVNVPACEVVPGPGLHVNNRRRTKNSREQSEGKNSVQTNAGRCKICSQVRLFNPIPSLDSNTSQLSKVSNPATRQHSVFLHKLQSSPRSTTQQSRCRSTLVFWLLPPSPCRLVLPTMYHISLLTLFSRLVLPCLPPAWPWFPARSMTM